MERTPAAKEPATTDPEGSRTGAALGSVRCWMARWEARPLVAAGAVAGALPFGLVVLGTVAAGGGVVVGAPAAGLAGAGAGADGAGAGGDAAGAAGVVDGRRRVQPGSIQCGSVRLAPPGWGRPSLSW